jgi:hypothetical protein
MVPTSVPALSRTSFTADPGLPVYVQVTVCVVPRCQLSPPFGEVTVIEGVVVAAVTVTTRRSIKSPARGITILDVVLDDIE